MEEKYKKDEREVHIQYTLSNKKKFNPDELQ